MPVLAAPLFWSAVVGGGAALAGGAMASKGASKSADTQAKALYDSGQLQAKSAADTLAFEKEQAAQTRADTITAQNANYGQWGYRQNTIRPYQSTGLEAENTLGQMLGLPPTNTHMPDIPAAPQFGPPSGQPPTSGPSGAAPSGDVTDLLTKNYLSLGVKPTGPGSGPTDIQYYAQKIGETGGATPQNLAYWMGPNGRIANDLKKAGAPPQNIGTTAGMPPVAPTPLGTNAPQPFQPLTLGAYAGMA